MIDEHHALKAYDSYKAFAIDTILLDEPLAFDLYIDNAGRLVKYVVRGTTLSASQKAKLLENRVHYFYITTADSQAFDDYLTHHLATVLNAPNLNREQKSRILYSSAIHVMHDLFENGVSQSKIAAAKALMNETIARIMANEVTAASILQLSSHDYKSYSHSVNVALYATGIAHEYGMNVQELQQVASGAILHDLGKCHIDTAIINKPAKLSMEEFETIKEHPQYGYDILVQNGETDPVILDIVLNHHEKLDGSGYRRKLDKEAISFATRIVTVADIFDALSTNRAYKKAAGFFVALKTMKVQMRHQLDMALVDSLIKMMGKA